MSPARHRTSNPELVMLQAEATYTRERYQLYGARPYGSRPTDASRLQKLKVASQRAEARLRRAKTVPSNN